MKYRYNEKGEHVKRLQQRLVRAGYSLPEFGSDGHFGAETLDVMELYARDQKLGWEFDVPKNVTDALMRADDVTAVDIPVRVEFGDDLSLKDVRFVDIRNEAGVLHPKSRTVGGRTVRRNPAAVKGITIHQMAVDMQPSLRLVREANGDWALAFARRSQKVACHVTAAPSVFCATNPLDWYMYHGNRLNGPTLGLEVAGLYSGLLDDPATEPREDLRTTWKSEPMEITPEIVAGARAALRWMVEEGRRLGMPIQYVYAHRQSNKNKPGDPGEGLWRALVVEYAVPVLGLKPNYGFTIGGGRPIPKEWDDNGVGKYR